MRSIMFNVLKKILLSLGLASIVFGCRSEFGYKDSKAKRPGGVKTPSLRIMADRTAVNLNSAVNFSATCVNNGSVTTISWDFGDNTTANGQQVTHQFSQYKSYTVKAYCRGAQLLTDTITINVGTGQTPGQPGQYPGQYPGSPGKGDGGKGNVIDDTVDIPQQPRWKPEGYYGDTNYGKTY